MTDKSGRRYVCTLPAAGVPPADSETGGGTAATSDEAQKAGQPRSELAPVPTAGGDGTAVDGGPDGSLPLPQRVKSPFELLEGLTALCLYRQEGMWTYEMCFKKQARQFRQVRGAARCTPGAVPSTSGGSDWH